MAGEDPLDPLIPVKSQINAKHTSGMPRLAYVVDMNM